MTPLDPTRRFVLAASASLAVVACGKKKPRGASAPPGPAQEGSLRWAVAGVWRTPADRARDPWRHPIESLAFWGLKPGMTVVEFWPGTGWYTDILAPYLTASNGRLYAANLETDLPGEPASAAVVGAYRKKLAARPDLYGRVTITAFGPKSGPVAPAGSADLVLFLRNLHNWMAAGIADRAFREAYLAMKPGGVLGVEEHRAKVGGPPDVMASAGYVQEAYVRQLAKDAGFLFDRASEINANPRDTKDHPFGVWTLPPTRLSAPRGKPPKPGFDHAKYDAIGESDRMTLRFIKPR